MKHNVFGCLHANDRSLSAKKSKVECQVLSTWTYSGYKPTERMMISKILLSVL